MQARLEGIKSIDLTKFLKHVNLYDNDLPDKFKKNFVNWISNSKLNTIEGLDKFNSISLSNGSIQIFDHFYLQYYEKRFRFFKGEFMYHKAVCKHKLNYKFIEDDYINSYDAFIISVPYTRKGKIHPDMFGILDKCEELQIPVLLDFAHLPIARNIDIDLTKYKCIETLAFSLSKFCYGAEYLRIGVRMQKENIDDGIDVFNRSGIEMFSRINIGIANELIHEYDVDNNWNTFGNTYSDVCKKNNLTECDNILMGFNKDERIIVAQKII